MEATIATARVTITAIGGVMLLAVAVNFFSMDAIAVAPSAESGRETSSRWCGSCHAVGTGDDYSSDYYTASSFFDVAQTMPPLSLRQYLAKPHIGPMPGFTLNEREVEDVAAFIETMRPTEPLVDTSRIQP